MLSVGPPSGLCHTAMSPARPQDAPRLCQALPKVVHELSGIPSCLASRHIRAGAVAAAHGRGGTGQNRVTPPVPAPHQPHAHPTTSAQQRDGHNRGMGTTSKKLPLAREGGCGGGSVPGVDAIFPAEGVLDREAPVVELQGGEAALIQTHHLAVAQGSRLGAVPCGMGCSASPRPSLGNTALGAQTLCGGDWELPGEGSGPVLEGPQRGDSGEVIVPQRWLCSDSPHVRHHPLPGTTSAHSLTFPIASSPWLSHSVCTTRRSGFSPQFEPLIQLRKQSCVWLIPVTSAEPPGCSAPAADSRTSH